MKYCISCGKQNEDQALFCIGCGQRFPNESTPVQQAGNAAAAPPPQPTSLFTIEKLPGAHKYSDTDSYLKDSAGKVLLVAKRESLLHENYTIVDGVEATKGFIERKAHLTHSELRLEDAGHNVQGSILVSSIRTAGVPPICWIEDANGDRQGSVMFTNGLLGFSVVKLDGSRAFDASFTSGPGLRQFLTAMEHRVYEISLVDSSFPLPMLLTVVLAIEGLTLTTRR
jgi:hypothetical protein